MMKRAITMIVMSIFLLSLVGCKANKNETTPNTTSTIETPLATVPDSTVQEADPWVEVSSLEEARTLTGKDYKTPETALEGYEQTGIRVMSDQLMEVTYKKGADTITYRVCASDMTDLADISGVNGDFGQVETINVENIEGEMRGNEDIMQVAVWSDAANTYSVVSTEGMTTEQMLTIVEGL